MTTTYIGIDFGTTKTAVCKFVEGSKTPQTINLQRGKSEVPTLIALDNDTGEVVEWGDDLETQYPDPSKATVYQEFKWFTGTDNEVVHRCTDGKEIRIAEAFFREVYNAIWLSYGRASLTESAGYRFIMGCPAEWGENQRERVVAEARQAGFESLELLDEPIAIAHFHRWNHDIQFGDDPFLVFDFGGATLNAGVFRLYDHTGFDKLAVSGADKGGSDFDVAIETLQQEKIPTFLDKATEDKIGAKIYCKRLKENFSDKISKNAALPATQLWEGVTLSLDREEFETRCSALIQLVPDTIKKMLDDNRLTPSRIKNVIISGGSSRFYFVQPKIEELFPHLKNDHIHRSADKNSVVAQGLVVSKETPPHLPPPPPPPVSETVPTFKEKPAIVEVVAPPLSPPPLVPETVPTFKDGDNIYLSVQGNVPRMVIYQSQVGKDEFNSFPKDDGDYLVPYDDGVDIRVWSKKGSRVDREVMRINAKELLDDLQKQITGSPNDKTKWKTVREDERGKVTFTFVGIQRLYELQSIRIPDGSKHRKQKRYDGGRAPGLQLQINMNGKKMCCIKSRDKAWESDFPSGQANRIEVKEGMDEKFILHLRDWNVGMLSKFVDIGMFSSQVNTGAFCPKGYTADFSDITLADFEKGSIVEKLGDLDDAKCAIKLEFRSVTP